MCGKRKPLHDVQAVGCRHEDASALHYAVWVLPIVRLMIPVTIDSSVRLFVVPRANEQQQDTTPAYQPAADDAALPQGGGEDTAVVTNGDGAYEYE